MLEDVGGLVCTSQIVLRLFDSPWGVVTSGQPWVLLVSNSHVLPLMVPLQGVRIWSGLMWQKVPSALSVPS